MIIDNLERKTAPYIQDKLFKDIGRYFLIESYEPGLSGINERMLKEKIISNQQSENK